MAARKKAGTRRAAPRRAYGFAKKKGRRTNTLNKSVKKSMQAAGVAIGAMIPYAGSVVEAVKSKSISPVSSAVPGISRAMCPRMKSRRCWTCCSGL